MWAYVSSMKGKKLECKDASSPHHGNKFWFSVEKSMPERLLSAKTKRAATAICTHITSNGLCPAGKEVEDVIKTHLDSGRIWWQQANGAKIRLIERSRTSDELILSDTFSSANLGNDGQAFLAAGNAS